MGKVSMAPDIGRYTEKDLPKQKRVHSGKERDGTIRSGIFGLHIKKVFSTLSL